jgi:hypothetical protein
VIVLFRIGVLAALVAALLPAPVARAQLRTLPTPLCALVGVGVTCYDAGGTPRALTPASAIVVDFDISPDGEWVAYRAVQGDQTRVALVSIFGGEAFEVDPNAPPPGLLDPDKTTLAWSPDGYTLTYVVAAGLRTAFPAIDGSPRYSQVLNRLYTDLRFSPEGSHLAAQSDDGGWAIFRLADRLTINARVEPIRNLNVASEVAWQDETQMFVAPHTGGLYRINAADPAAQYSPLGASGIFTQLIRLPDGTLRAFIPEIGRGFGRAVEIKPDGSVEPLGETNLDDRLRWTRQGRAMLYLTSGTPIVVNPATGLEDTLPVRNASRVVWKPQRLDSAPALQVDADIFFLAPDPLGVNQVWRLVRNGQSAIFPLTGSAVGISAYQVSPDKSQLALIEGRALRVLPLTAIGIATPTPTLRPLFGTPTPAPPSPLATLNTDQATFAWNADSSQIAFADDSGVYVVAATGVAPVRLVAAHLANRRYHAPQFSPDGGALLVEALNAPAGRRDFVVLPLRDSFPRLVIPPLADNGIDVVGWTVPNSNRVGLVVVAVSAAGTTRLTLINESGEQLLAEFAQPVLGATFARNLTNPPLYLFTLAGWRRGPQLVQYFSLLASTTGQPTVQAIGAPFLFSGAIQISPTGRFALSVQRHDDPDRSHLLIILDLQNLRKIALMDAVNVSAVQWVF